jgi:hypothetical protein
MRPHRLTNARILAVMLRVIAAHHALQLGKFADHAGCQVGLGQQRRALRQCHIGTHEGCDYR